MIRMFHVRAHFSLLTCIEATVGGERGRWRGKGGGGGGGGKGEVEGEGEGGTQQMFIRGGSVPRSNSLPFHKPVFM